MKKLLRILFLMSVFMVLLCATAMAAEEEGIVDITPVQNNSFTVSPEKGGKDQLRLTVTNAEVGEQYLVVVLSDDSGKPTADNIVYIDQKSADNGSVTFEKVYPSQLTGGKTYYVYLSSTNVSLTPVVTFKYQVSYKLGYVDDNDKLTANDALWALEGVVGRRVLSESQWRAANVDSNDRLTANDALWILEAVVGRRQLG